MDRDIYEGEFHEGLRQGIGKMIWKIRGEEYEGEWYQDEPHGKGKFKPKDGVPGGKIQEGWFVQGKFSTEEEYMT